MRLLITKKTPAYWRVTIDHPTSDHFDKEMADELRQLIEILEKDKEVKVVVFDSMDAECFIAHRQATRKHELKPEAANDGLSIWPDFANRIEKAPFVTIGLLRGRAKGAGSEFLLALDARFASRENAVLSQPNIADSLIPGGGSFERLPSLIGRSRALEVILGSQDFDADTAERYGWINRAVPDAELDVFVEQFAMRIAGCDKKAVVAAKQMINERSRLPHTEDLASTQDKFFELMSAPQTLDQLKALLLAGLHLRGDFERGLGDNHGISPLS